MNILLMSIFADSTPYLNRYLNLCHALDAALHVRGHRLSFLWGEGDSADNTRSVLEAARWRFRSEVLDISHGGQIYGSVDKRERFRQLAGVGTKMFAAIPADADVAIWCESDLIWQPDTLVGMAESLSDECAAIAPSILLRRDDWPDDTWYDTLAFVSGGKHFQHRPPYHPGNNERDMLEMESVGSCLAMQADMVRNYRMDESVIMGVCAHICRQGGRVWYNPKLPPAIHE